MKRPEGARQRPRLAPPPPKRSDGLNELAALADARDRPLLWWQRDAYSYVMAKAKGRWLYPEVAIIAGRQNGKTDPVTDRIVYGLLRGERILHSSHIRRLTEEMHESVSAIMEKRHSNVLAPRYGIRRGKGQEEINTKDGGSYKITAANAGPRGGSNDLLVIDETRELHDYTYVSAAQPTTLTSKAPQTIWLSNAGDNESIVLNDLRARAGHDNDLAYIEYSADPDFDIDDREGWRQANPGLGAIVTMEALESARKRLPATVFETEHLCRWVPSMLPRIVQDVTWARLVLPGLMDAAMESPHLGICIDPQGRRATICAAWRREGRIAVRVLADIPGPIDPDELTERIRGIQKDTNAVAVGYDPWEAKLVESAIRRGKKVGGQEAVAASARFAAVIDSGQIAHEGNPALTLDMTRTVRRSAGPRGWYAAPASGDVPTTASLAALRAVWLASAPPRPTPTVR